MTLVHFSVWVAEPDARRMRQRCDHSTTMETEVSCDIRDCDIGDFLTVSSPTPYTQLRQLPP